MAARRRRIVGSDVRFQPRGSHELKGVPGAWELYRVVGRDTRLKSMGVDPLSWKEEDVMEIQLRSPRPKKPAEVE
jgi:hypothetical protein